MTRTALFTRMVSTLSSMSHLQRQLADSARMYRGNAPPDPAQAAMHSRVENAIQRTEEIVDEAAYAIISMNLDITA